MRQVQIAKVHRTRTQRRYDELLPLDPRDMDVVRAKQLQRERTETPPTTR
ncbi:hypothetical protein EV643_12942 [Kribbella sp. VKM Ac-2527]|uniref:Uncharacterized protein n=1 Tax=Kribbella caucasensis TaxID=2512215 RepID=A0A4R6JDM6_9ACTN|nr:hypothetical protein [Kribbella sp. VKM Ac-2527]TDO33944.1 hypothetical protein EV643_12942 [Kribbella sp. VKM Ac-2527]